jgi:predicted RNase H-like nuclease (RuvC/YqgF family)
MSVEFSNAYQEILLENLQGIIKQNFMFQTQIKLLESGSKDKENLQKSLSELKTKYDELHSLYNSKQGDLKQIDVYKNKAEQNNSILQEKNRIQTALNDEMRKSSILKKEVDEVKNELELLKQYVSKLEEIAPATKLKKIKSTDDVKIETPKVENKIQPKVLVGNTF